MNLINKCFLGITLYFISLTFAFSQQTAPTQVISTVEKQLLQLSKDKWQWMSEKDVDKLGKLFDKKARFVHMSGTWKTPRELEIIQTGSIWYKEAKVQDTAVSVSGKTAIVWNRITLVAHVRGDDVSNEFTVTEVYQKKKKEWKMMALTFSSVKDTHELQN